MVRTQIYLTVEERKGLKILGEATGKKQAELIRDAVDYLIEQSGKRHRDAILNNAAGMWSARKDLPDFRVLRKSLDRS